jgi:predicted metal-dependent phosphoesterase TrpH
MKIDLHCHTKYSGDNYLEPEELIEQALKVNLNGVCITNRWPGTSQESGLPLF